LSKNDIEINSSSQKGNYSIKSKSNSLEQNDQVTNEIKADYNDLENNNKIFEVNDEKNSDYYDNFYN